MKFQVTMKTPDALESILVDEIGNHSSSADIQTKLACAIDGMREVSRKFFLDGEHVTLEIDTDAQTCTVVPVGE